ncbi:MAG: GNAT family N-acetyltransferase [Chitinophaga sp.]|uniref:GNAT family N-acetyltransferase n=1 Tax=Chitinophaga sp. TaxID=1869181 RepID=UPI001B2833A2|nr:GNAT family N-acetyltransferase [Chitinophaga sp.]MBO9728552.1 GNAT family N-acetyltransferase [Chitinophaga sp.]
MSTLHIRNAQISDAEQLSEMIYENTHAMLKPHYNQLQWETFVRYYSVPVLREKISAQAVFCAEINNKIVGTIALDGDFVVGFYTRLENMRQGIGKLLMDHLESYAASLGLTELQLGASPEGLAFYYKNGWQKVRDFTIYHYNVGYEETLMSKIIAPKQ